jgi:hypothetical protein
MATQTIGYLPGQDPGDMQANQEYQQALQRMLASLDARKNRMFDPTMLAMAEGFLKPTKQDRSAKVLRTQLQAPVKRRTPRPSSSRTSRSSGWRWPARGSTCSARKPVSALLSR